MLDRNARAPLLQPPTPPIEPRVGVRHRLGLTPRARYSSIYVSSNRSHLLIAVLPNEIGGEPTLARLNVTETNNMTSNMTALEAGIGPELN